MTGYLDWGYMQNSLSIPPASVLLCSSIQQKKNCTKETRMKKSRRVSTALLIRSPICSSMYLPILVSRTTYYVGYTQKSIDIISFHRFYKFFKSMSSRPLMLLMDKWKLTDFLSCQKIKIVKLLNISGGAYCNLTKRI